MFVTRQISRPIARAANLRALMLIRSVPIGALAFLFLVMQQMPGFARGAPESFADLVEVTSPAVVNITTTTKIETNITPRGIVPEGSPFEDLFRDFQERNPEGAPPRRASALGSGFIISEDGFMVTNNHVIEGADEIMVEFSDGSERAAKIIGVDKNIDIALLKVDTDVALGYVSFGNSDFARVGDWVMAIGNPLGQGFSVSAGIISARNRELSGYYDDYIQTDAAINRGNSGGPLFNMDGEVIGVNTAILSPNGGSIGIGFSMSSNVVAPVVAQLREFGEVRRGWLGVTIGNVTEDIAEALGLDDPSGAIVQDVATDGPADKGGLQATDVIVMFDGIKVANSGELVRVVGKAPVGKTVNVVVLRDGKRKTLQVTLGQRPSLDELARSGGLGNQPPEEPEVVSTFLGIGLMNIDPKLREEKGLDESAEGLFVHSVDEASDAYQKGLRVGDIITDAGQKSVTSVEEFADQLASTKEAGRQSILVLARREGQPRFVVLNLE